MTRNTAWAGQAKTVQPSKGAKSIACLLFVAAMGCAFWAGALWAAQPWLR